MSNTGPLVDHTLGTSNGWYMYVDSRNGTSYDLATLRSETLHNSGGQCELSFWYHMYGTYIGMLSVVIRYGTTELLVWQLSNNQGDSWTQAVVNVGRIPATFNIVFKAKRSYMSGGDIAIDDIELASCALPPVAPSCGDDELRCARGACVHEEDVCDFADDCGDATDEAAALCATYDTCDFERASFCNWTHAAGGNTTWQLNSGSTSSSSTGPLVDHTTRSSTGMYIYVESSNQPVNSTAAIKSIGFKSAGQTSSCYFRFYYNMYGGKMGSLTVYQVSSAGKMTSVWERSGNAGPTWHRASIKLTESDSFQVVVEARLGFPYTSDTAVDDMSFSPGCEPLDGGFTTVAPVSCDAATEFACANGMQCVPLGQLCDFAAQCSDGSDEATCGECDFEGDACGWKDVSTKAYKWVWTTAQDSMAVNKPPSDHTLGMAQGHYMLADGSLSGNLVTYATMQTPVFQEVPLTCMVQFYYYLNGGTYGYLDVYIANATQPSSRSLLFYDYVTSSAWREVVVDIGGYPSGKMLQLEVFTLNDVSTSTSFPGGTTPYPWIPIDVAIDDVSYINCTVGFRNPDINCTFDDGWCGWYRDRTYSQFDWIRTSGVTGSVNTGPTTDHTTGSGYYVYIETSTPQKAGDISWLITTLQDSIPTAGACLRFWYHMFGENVDTLNVYYNHKDTNVLIWSLTGNKGNQWWPGQAWFAPSGEYYLIMEGVVGNGYMGDIALDDILVTPGNCPTTKICHFEVDLCGWTSDSTGDYKWKRGQNGSSILGTGPERDHTTNTTKGYFVYVDPLDNDPHKKGRLVSPTYDYTSTAECLDFWYHITNNTGVLNVYIKENNQIGSPLWSLSGDHGNMWRFAMVNLKPKSGSFQAVIEGVISPNPNREGTLAVDDVWLDSSPCPPMGSCTFERHVCTFYNDRSSATMDWLRTNGQTTSFYTGPSIDHTLGTAQGYYMYIETSTPASNGDNAIMLTEYMPATDTGTCLSFWYHMFGQDIGRLTVYLLDAGTDWGNGQSIFNLTGEQGNVWVNINVTIIHNKEFQIAFEGVVGSGYMGDIALDDVYFYDGVCHGQATPTTTDYSPTTVTFPASQYDCDFEGNTKCSWTDDPTGDFTFALQQGNTVSVSTGPSTDHTTGTSSGWYIYIEVTGVAIGFKARLLSDLVNINTAGKCVKFWYHMYGADVATLSLYARQDPDVLGDAIWYKDGNQGDAWMYGQVHLSDLGSRRIVFEAMAGANFLGDIAIDDITVNDGDCPPQDASCDFESSDMCGYKHDVTSDFKWRWNQGHAGSSGSGPSADHTYGTSFGHYVYIETSAQVAGETARLISGPHAQTDGKCLKFYYHMYGDHVDTLNVYLKQSAALGQPVWTMSGNQGDTWFHGMVDVKTPITYHVVFEGVVGASSKGDIALDDIILMSGDCPPPGTCDFEYDTCGFTNVIPGADFSWIRWRGPTPNYGSGPHEDHTLGATGTYIIASSDYPQLSGDRALLKSTEFTGGTKRCLVFWYYMYGAYLGTLNIIVNTIPGKNTTVWSKTHEQGPVWHLAEVDLNIAENYVIIFEGIIGDTYSSDIALDDISLHDKTCNKTVLPPTTFKCVSNGIILSADKQCNFDIDCQDGSDEVECGDCDFEKDNCRYTEESYGDFQWHRGRNGSYSANTGPSVDHTLGTSLGWYQYVDSRNGTSYDLSMLHSPYLHNAGGPCQLVFFYHMYGSSIGTLLVVLTTGYRETVIWDESYDQGDVWREGIANVGRVPAEFRLAFKGKRGYAATGDIAIDDVSLRYCDVPRPQPTCPPDSWRCGSARGG
ncbi:PREDICTED: MAM and LDL-receptor class A domain-containing protein 1-like [Priapulus caudatus]|uniref:MAM and LDL-receptor class A domain-containing protein 1-like n=1 Tax=Priapulus caudatus TaxID=37621 RepID=A0ABM1F968_PRICU|nr:PREDICTED: MAM and LDL-receptor class A domain-containing protein 1-like [Priapulus caudatus]